jgi:hypothetical protein
MINYKVLSPDSRLLQPMLLSFDIPLTLWKLIYIVPPFDDAVDAHDS